MVKRLHLCSNAEQKIVVAGEIWVILSRPQLGQGGKAGAFL